jgi:hypothetical protein
LENQLEHTHTSTTDGGSYRRGTHLQRRRSRGNEDRLRRHGEADGSRSPGKIRAGQDRIGIRAKGLVALQQQIRTLEDKISRDSSVMSETESSKLERDVLAKRRDLKRSQEEFRDDLNIRRNEVLAKLQKDIYDVVVAFAKEQNYDLILTQGVVYSSDKVDVTDSVLKKLKQ